MTDAELDAIRQRNEQRRRIKDAATPGPWQWLSWQSDPHGGRLFYAIEADGGITCPPGFLAHSLVAPKYGDADDLREGGYAVLYAIPVRDCVAALIQGDAPDAVFVAHARNDPVEADVDALLAEVDRLRATVCSSPNATQCARLWESDHQGAALAQHGLLGEYGDRGCDAIDSVCSDLIHLRRAVRRMRSALAAEPPEPKLGPKNA